MDKIEVIFDYTHFSFDNIDDAIQFYKLCKKSYGLNKLNVLGEKKTLMLSMVYRQENEDEEKEDD